MRIIQVLAGLAVFCWAVQQRDCRADTIMCDPNEKIPVTVNVMVDDKTLDDLQQKGVEELALTPASDFFWTKSFPLESETAITLYDEADPLTLSFQEGLLVTYSKGCDEDVVYTFCHMDGVDLKGEFPKEVNLYLNPALGKCTIEVVCTQCP